MSVQEGHGLDPPQRGHSGFLPRPDGDPVAAPHVLLTSAKGEKEIRSEIKSKIN